MRKRKSFGKTGSDVIDDIPCKQNGVCWSCYFASKYRNVFIELSTMIARAQQQRHATATQFDSSELFVCRLEEHERTLCVLTTRIEESYAQEISFSIRFILKALTWYLEQAIMSLRGNCRRSRERYGLL